MAGFGTSFSAFYLAREIGCEVIEIDIAELSIEKAKGKKPKRTFNLKKTSTFWKEI